MSYKAVFYNVMQLLLYEYRWPVISKIQNENWADIHKKKMEEQTVW